MPGTSGRERLHACCVHRRIGKPEGGQRPEWRQDNPDRRWETVLHGRALLCRPASLRRRQMGPQVHHDGPTPRALLGLIYAHGAHYDKCMNARSAHFLVRPPPGRSCGGAQCASDALQQDRRTPVHAVLGNTPGHYGCNVFSGFQRKARPPDGSQEGANREGIADHAAGRKTGTW